MVPYSCCAFRPGGPWPEAPPLQTRWDPQGFLPTFAPLEFTQSSHIPKKKKKKLTSLKLRGHRSAVSWAVWPLPAKILPIGTRSQGRKETHVRPSRQHCFQQHITQLHTYGHHCRHTRPHVSPRVAHASRKQQNYVHQLGWWWGSNFLRWTEYPQDTSSGGVNPPPGPGGAAKPESHV